jgi:hypothetical protein
MHSTGWTGGIPDGPPFGVSFRRIIGTDYKAAASARKAECAEPSAGRRFAEDGGDALACFARCFIGEGDGWDLVAKGTFAARDRDSRDQPAANRRYLGLSENFT